MIASSLLRLGLALGIVLGLTFRNVTAAQKSVEPPSAEECAEFGEWLAARFQASEYAEIVRRFDALAIGRKATAGLDLDEKTIAEFSAGMHEASTSSFGNKHRHFHSARFLRVQERDGQRRVLLRFLGGEGVFLYQAFVCGRGADNRLMWTDWFDYTTSQYFSASLKHMVAPLSPLWKGKKVEDFIAQTPTPLVATTLMQQAMLLFQQGKPAEALARLRKRPEELRKDKFFLLFEISLAQAVDEKTHLQALTDLEEAFPDDSTLGVVLLDGDYIRKDYPSILRRLTSLEKELGGDAHIHNLRAHVHIMQENWPAAKRYARAALADEPKLFSAYDTLIAIATTQKDYREIAAILAEIETNFPAMDMLEGIKDEPSYADFRKSSAYTDWIATRAKRAPSAHNGPHLDSQGPPP